MAPLGIEEQAGSSDRRSGHMNKLSPILLFAGIAVCACSSPVISDINDSAVKVQSAWYNNQNEAMAEANRGCGLYGKRAVPISSRCLDGYCSNKELLFACQGPSPVISQPNFSTSLPSSVQAPAAEPPSTAAPAYSAPQPSSEQPALVPGSNDDIGASLK